MGRCLGGIMGRKKPTLYISRVGYSAGLTLLSDRSGNPVIFSVLIQKSSPAAGVIRVLRGTPQIPPYKGKELFV